MASSLLYPTFLGCFSCRLLIGKLSKENLIFMQGTATHHKYQYSVHNLSNMDYLRFLSLSCFSILFLHQCDHNRQLQILQIYSFTSPAALILLAYCIEFHLPIIYLFVYLTGVSEKKSEISVWSCPCTFLSNHHLFFQSLYRLIVHSYVSILNTVLLNCLNLI